MCVCLTQSSSFSKLNNNSPRSDAYTCVYVCVYTTHVLVELVKDRSPRLGCFQMCMYVCVCVCVCVSVYICVCVCAWVCVAIWQWRKSRDEKLRFFYAYHLHSLSSRSFTRSFKKTHSGGGFFWQGFLVVLRKLLSNFHRKFANLEKPWFLLASVNGPTG